MKSGRAKELFGAAAGRSHFEQADVILLDWGADGDLNQAVIVNEVDDGESYLSSETANRQSKPAREYFSKTVPEFMAEKYKEGEYSSRAYSYSLLDPLFRESNRR